MQAPASGMLLILVLGVALMPPAEADESRPAHSCASSALVGDWVSDDGLHISVRDARTRGMQWEAVVVHPDGSVGVRVYSRIQAFGTCRWAARRHSTPYAESVAVILALDRETGMLREEGEPSRIFKRP